MKIHDFTRLGDTEAVRREMANGTAVDSRDERDFTPLASAASGSKADESIAALLIELGADVNETDDLGFYSKRLGNAGHTSLDYSTGTIGECVSRQIEDLLRSKGALTKAEIDTKGS